MDPACTFTGLQASEQVSWLSFVLPVAPSRPYRFSAGRSVAFMRRSSRLQSLGGGGFPPPSLARASQARLIRSNTKFSSYRFYRHKKTRTQSTGPGIPFFILDRNSVTPGVRGERTICFLSRSSDFRILLLTVPSHPETVACIRLSYPVTAAGPRRDFTVFPIKALGPLKEF